MECSKAGTLTAEYSRSVTDLAVAALAEAGVIRPWQIKLKSGQGEQQVGGLHRIDGAALDGLAEHRYCFSLTRKSCRRDGLPYFEQLAKFYSQLTPPPVATVPKTIDSLFVPSEDLIRFD